MSTITVNSNSGSSSYKTITIRVLIAALLIDALVWAGSIMFGSSETSLLSYETPVTTRFNLMFWVFAEALIASILAFRCLEKGEGIARILAMVGLGACAVSVVLQLLTVWEIIPLVESSGLVYGGISVMGKLMLVATTTMAAATGGALVSIIEENGESIGMLKYTALGCGICFWLVTVMMVFVDSSSSVSLYTKGLPISGAMVSAFIVTCVAAVLMSWFNRRDRIEAAIARIGKKPVIEDNDEKSNTGLDEIIEKSVEQRIAKEKELAARPPLQADDMAPTISREGGVKLERKSETMGVEPGNDATANLSEAVAPTVSFSHDPVPVQTAPENPGIATPQTVPENPGTIAQVTPGGQGAAQASVEKPSVASQPAGLASLETPTIKRM